jgi:type I restriction enzyme S subunit
MSFGQPYIMKIDGCIHDGWLAFSNYNGIVMDYLYYTLQSHFCATQFGMSVDGGVVKNLNIDKVGDTFISLPPIEEQSEIAEYLDRRCGEIDKQIGAVTKQIELLREYKQALITEVVTGKRKV